ncbi:ABC transporter permease [Paraflavitalea pollutisoli]|uniref:ABC transporter permease n=1 Tax=Paraflavitalea pollutisoli TaxID=3034143 RepID=UPI0023EB5A03|nr:ABC transporter permease [Paraflavitalea sp. H1-2-19X]
MKVRWRRTCRIPSRLPTDDEAQRNLESFVTSLRQQSAVQQYSVGSSVNVDDLTAGTTFAYSGNKKRELMCNYFYIDKNFVPMLHIPLVEGRNLSDSLVTDRQSGFIVNEAFVRSMGWKQGLGQTIEGFDRKGPILGVVRDFHYKSMHNAVEPLVLIYYRQPVQTVIVKVKPKDIPAVAGLWKQHYPDTIFDYAFLDENYREQYGRDRGTMQLFSFFTLLAIAISCLG